MRVYADLGVRRVINAWGPMTIIGSALVRPEVVSAMAEAAECYVDLIDLQRAAGRRLAEMIGVEACYVAGGAAAGLAVSTAACVTGTDMATMSRLPDIPEGRRQVIMQRSHRNPYDHAIRQVGIELVEIGNAWATFDWQLTAALNPATAAVVYLYGHRTMHEPLSLTETVEIAHAHGVPVIVDAAAEVPPARNLTALAATGADFVVISGGKGLRGPQNSALVLTTSDRIEACLINACPNHSLGRSMKVTKEDIIGLVKAVELYLALDHEAVARGWEEDVALVVDQLAGIAGICVERAQATYTEDMPVARIAVDEESLGRSAAAIAAELAAGDPSVQVGHKGDQIDVNPHLMQPGDLALVVERLREALFS